MKKSDLIDALQYALDDHREMIRGITTKKEVTQILAAMEHVMLRGLVTGREVPIGLGKLKVVTRAARTGRNPKTGEQLHIPACKVVKFVPSKVTKDVMRDGEGAR